MQALVVHEKFLQRRIKFFETIVEQCEHECETCSEKIILKTPSAAR